MYRILASYAVAIILVFSQVPATTKPSFEVISIKRSVPGPGPTMEGFGGIGDRFTASGTLRLLLNIFSGASNKPSGDQLRIINAPDWIDTDRYEIEAKIACGGGRPSREQLRLMVRSMLEDRFQLKSHMETRELPVYNLVVAKDGPKAKRSKDQTPVADDSGPPPLLCASAPATPPGSQGNSSGPRGLDPLAPRPMPRGRLIMRGNPITGGLTMVGTAVPFSNFVSLLQWPAGRRVIDETKLTGLFDFELSFLPEDPGNALGPGGPPLIEPRSAAEAEPVPSIFAALQKQLGLRLESAKGAVEVLVIESVQKPTAN